jgi:hypothetical protein
MDALHSTARLLCDPIAMLISGTDAMDGYGEFGCQDMGQSSLHASQGSHFGINNTKHNNKGTNNYYSAVFSLRL